MASKASQSGLVLAWIAACIAASGVGAAVLEPVFIGAESAPIRAAWALAFGLASAAIPGVPLAFYLRKQYTQFARRIAETPERGTPLRGACTGIVAPLARAVDALVEQYMEKLEKINNRVREAEIRLSVSEAERKHYESILDGLNDAVLVTDTFNEITLANSAASKLLGFERDGALHKPIQELIRDASIASAIGELSQSGVRSKQTHFEHTFTPGEDTPPEEAPLFDVTLSALPDENKAVGGVVTIFRDITREKEISRMKTEFVSQASHELRTPLSSINAYIEMLIDSEATDEENRQEFYQIIKTEAERVSRMIDNMLNISRIEAGIVKVERSEVDFVKVTKEVIETMAPSAKAKNIMLADRSGPLMYTAEADRDLVYQVIMNLVGNAIKYTPDDGRVTITIENDDSTSAVLVTVADTGLGIPPDSIDQVFNKFYRIDNYKRVAKGTGLGLNLVKHIVETVHRGQVGVRSEVGMGSQFWFTIPYAYAN
ncbi:MAG: ATP-binding protein [Phycisphaerales bacterium]